MRIAYENSEGKIFEFTENEKIRVTHANFHKYAYKYEGVELEYGIKLKRFKKDPGTYPITLYFYGSARKRAKRMDDLHELVSIDRINKSIQISNTGITFFQFF